MWERRALALGRGQKGEDRAEEKAINTGGRRAGVADKCDLRGSPSRTALTGKPISLILPSYNTHRWTPVKKKCAREAAFGKVAGLREQSSYGIAKSSKQ